MKFISRNTWIIGVACLIAGFWDIYYYTTTNNWQPLNIGATVFVIFAGVINLVSYVLIKRF